MTIRKQPGGREIKRLALDFLQARDYNESLDGLMSLPPRQVVNALISFFCHNDEKTRRRAIKALGLVTARLASKERERARVVMRRLMWMLNDESGGIGWGAPEAIGEIAAQDAGLADEYAHMLVSYLDEDGNYLEYEPLQRGLLWAIVRVAESRPEHMRDAKPYLPKYLRSKDPEVRGLAAMALGALNVEEARSELEALADDPSMITLYVDDDLVKHGVGNLARESLSKLSR